MLKPKCRYGTQEDSEKEEKLNKQISGRFGAAPQMQSIKWQEGASASCNQFVSTLLLSQWLVDPQSYFTIKPSPRFALQGSPATPSIVIQLTMQTLSVA
jgi:hypothetical protein